MTFGAAGLTDLELSRLPPVEQKLAKALAAELGKPMPNSTYAVADVAEAGIDLGIARPVGGIAAA